MGCWSLLAICVFNFLYAGGNQLHELRVCRDKPRPAQLAALRRIVRDARWLVERAPEDGAAQTASQNFPQVLKRKRVGYTSEEISRPQPLTLLEIIPGLPPAGAVGIVDPLTLAAGDVREALIDPSLVLLPEAERVGIRPARVHATDEEWNKIGVELLRRGVVVEIARDDAPIVGGQPVLVGAFGVDRRGTPIPPATRVLRLIVNAIPSNKQQTAIKGDIEHMPVGGEWLHIALESDEIVLRSSDDIQGCFHVFSLPPAWRRWMILSKPIRVALSRCLRLREALNSLGVPRAAEKGASREAVGITMGSVIDGITGRAAPTLRKILDHVSLTSWLLTQSRVCRLWLQAATGRWAFDFQDRRPCFAALDHVWKEIVQFHGWRPISTTCA